LKGTAAKVGCWREVINFPFCSAFYANLECCCEAERCATSAELQVKADKRAENNILLISSCVYLGLAKGAERSQDIMRNVEYYSRREKGVQKINFLQSRYSSKACTSNVPLKYF
jgi:hypothetical protein